MLREVLSFTLNLEVPKTLLRKRVLMSATYTTAVMHGTNHVTHLYNREAHASPILDPRVSR
jgi:hypothetical protein